MGINMKMLMHVLASLLVSVQFNARIITGVGMGGEYPLASSHSAESSEDSGDGARNVALLYLFGSGGGQALCPLVTYLMDVSGMPGHLLWRWIFAVGSILPAGQHVALPGMVSSTMAGNGKSAMNGGFIWFYKDNHL